MSKASAASIASGGKFFGGEQAGKDLGDEINGVEVSVDSANVGETTDVTSSNQRS